MTLQEVKDLLAVAENISNRIHQEGILYSQLLEDSYGGLPKGLCIALDDLIDTMDKYLGDNGWVSWWAFDCNYGANPMEAGIDEDMIVVDTVEKLYNLAIGEMNMNA